jgi:bifunctional DNA-binding transcriptional regulator/antitoxin component of YhaV-PrlF toxin-antitoxin module
MTTATLKEITEKVGIKPDDVVTYHEEKGKGIIEVDFSVLKKQSTVVEEDERLGKILGISEELGIKDWAENHDHYIYGSPKKNEVK